MFKVIQVNLHHSKAATAALNQHLQQVGMDMALIQEPWINKNMVMGLNTSDDLVAAYVALPRLNGARLVVCSAYLPGETPNPSMQLAALVEYCEDQKVPLLIGCDSNAHHTGWGSTNTNPRGSEAT
ncbi:uncharacterized protein LOC126380906 isoform X2 [Pectinophora gossypiella]|uniref:uncharacterized protein LOC126380906 isoform X2 n=1 Tax=Pectinophora gossypiella TaxID=13191 RepID=UPI00214EB375|nr:uncharacterized protein LOC126380906 isoform X2 [Pectinophora gossypiella]